MSFEEEQCLLKQTATELLLFAHQRQEAYHIRRLTTTGKLEVSQENVQNLVRLYDLLDIDKIGLSEKVEKLLSKCIKVCESERQLKGSLINDYYTESLHIVTGRRCLHCGNMMENAHRKAKFCSDSCRVANHRLKLSDGQPVK